MAWVLSCLILSASFQSGQINNEVEVSQQSPLAQFNYAGKSYSLRFTGTKLENSDDQGDGPEAIVELTLGFIALAKSERRVKSLPLLIGGTRLLGINLMKRHCGPWP